MSFPRSIPVSLDIVDFMTDSTMLLISPPAQNACDRIRNYGYFIIINEVFISLPFLHYL